MPEPRPFNRVKPCRHGTMLYNPNDTYIGRSLDLYGEFSEGEVELFRQVVRPGMVVLDVGANIGAHTVFLAGAVGPEGRVLAFEPQRILYQALCGNVALNSLVNVYCWNAAVGAAPGDVRVPLPDYAQVRNFGALSLESQAEGERVPLLTIDGFRLPRCSFIKIDVEGMEKAVLDGAGETVARCQPLIYVENDRRDKAAALLDAVVALGYNAYLHTPPYFNPDNFAGNRTNVFGSTVSINMFCCPKNMPQRIAGLQRIEWPPRSAAGPGVSPADVENNAGVALALQGRREEALARFRAALRLRPDFPEALNNLGNALREQGSLGEAADRLREAVRLRPDFAAAWRNLGKALLSLGHWPEAAHSFRQALRSQPDLAETLNDLGAVLLELGETDQALARFHEAVRLEPGYAAAHCNLGIALARAHDLDKAIASYREALRLDPGLAEAAVNLGAALHDRRETEAAVGQYQHALRVQPDLAVAHTNLAAAFQDLGRLDEAVGHCRQALRLQPSSADAYTNLGAALHFRGDLDEAVASYGEALRLQPDLAEAHKGRAMVRLMRGDFEQGWPEYEWRWKERKAPKRPFRQPLWDGSPLAGRTILLHAEQGLGDTLQFIRYAALVKGSGGRVLAACPRSLQPILADCPGIDQLVGMGPQFPPFDVHAPLMSLPGIFRTSPATIPAQVPYLFADPGLVEQWRQELGEAGAFKIGIAWQGSRTYRGDRRRSIPLTAFEPVARVEGVRLFSLQKGFGAEQVTEVTGRWPFTDLGGRLDERAGAFMDTAAVMKGLDLVITSDTAVAHLAGALAVPVWVALSFVPEWRWLLDREDCPWYPTMRLFRQPAWGNWQAVFERMAAELAARL